MTQRALGSPSGPSSTHTLPAPVPAFGLPPPIPGRKGRASVSPALPPVAESAVPGRLKLSAFLDGSLLPASPDMIPPSQAPTDVAPPAVPPRKRTGSARGLLDFVRGVVSDKDADNGPAQDSQELGPSSIASLPLVSADGTAESTVTRKRAGSARGLLDFVRGVVADKPDEAVTEPTQVEPEHIASAVRSASANEEVVGAVGNNQDLHERRQRYLKTLASFADPDAPVSAVFPTTSSNVTAGDSQADSERQVSTIGHERIRYFSHVNMDLRKYGVALELSGMLQLLAGRIPGYGHIRLCRRQLKAISQLRLLSE